MYDELRPEDEPRIDRLVQEGYSEDDAILIIFQEKCARRQMQRMTHQQRLQAQRLQRTNSSLTNSINQLDYQRNYPLYATPVASTVFTKIFNSIFCFSCNLFLV